MKNNTAYINKVKAHILSHLNSFQHSATIYEASKYSIEAGGKASVLCSYYSSRMRSVLI